MWIRWTRAITEPVALADCKFALPPPGQTLSDLLGYYERMRGYVEHEDELINSRLTWSLTVHGFLFAAFGFLAGKVVDLMLELYKPHELAAAQQLKLIVLALIGLLLGVAIIGAAVGYLSREAIAAAHNAIQHLLAVVHGQGALQFQNWGPGAPVVATGSMLFPSITCGGDGGKDTGGAKSYYLTLPLLMTIAWIIIILAVVVFWGLTARSPFPAPLPSAAPVRGIF
jgi:hypothetical protein